jgi:hypothetical protein
MASERTAREISFTEMEINQRFNIACPAEPDKFRQAVTNYSSNQEDYIRSGHAALNYLSFI